MSLADVIPLNPPSKPKPVQRYVIKRLSGVLHWGIYDTHLAAWCALPDGTALVPLEWKSREDAQVWLYLCRVAWSNGLVRAPDHWL